jgi:DeoR/GlpR family transcriptional regulator of sugar metabolism
MNALRDSLYTVIRTTERIRIQTLAERFNHSITAIEMHLHRLVEEGKPIKIKDGYVINKDYGIIEKLIRSGNLFRRAKGRRVKL